MIAEINLPADKKRVPVFDIPQLIAEALYPRDPKLKPSNVKSTKKTPLTDDEWKMVKTAWPDARHADHDPAAGLRKDGEKEHHALLADNIRAGKLTVRFHTGIPVPPETKDLFHTFVTVDELRRYVARFDVGVRLLTPDVPEVSAPLKTAGANDDESATGKPHKKDTRWTDDDLQALRQDKESGKTDDELAEFHGLKRQRISVLLQNASDKFGEKSKTDISLAGYAARPLKIQNRK